MSDFMITDPNMTMMPTLSLPLILFSLVYSVQMFFSYGTAYRLTKSRGDNGIALFGWMFVLSFASIVPGVGIFLWFKFRNTDGSTPNNQQQTSAFAPFAGGNTFGESTGFEETHSDNAFNNPGPGFPPHSNAYDTNAYNNPGPGFPPPPGNAYDTNAYNNPGPGYPPPSNAYGNAYGEPNAPSSYMPYQGQGQGQGQGPDTSQFQSNSTSNAMKECWQCQTVYNSEFGQCPRCGS